MIEKDFAEWDENKITFVHSRMRDYEVRGADFLVTVEENVDVDGAGSVYPLAFGIIDRRFCFTSELPFNGFDGPEDVMRRRRQVEAHGSIQKLLVGLESPRLGLNQGRHCNRLTFNTFHIRKSLPHHPHRRKDIFPPVPHVAA